MIDNNSLTVPAMIGINDNTCLYWLHTHKTDGITHVEAPLGNYTLGQFLDIWNKTQHSSYVYTFSLLNNSTVKVYVNNVIYNGNYRDILLKDGEDIRIKV